MKPKPCIHVVVLADESTSMLGVAKGVRVGVNAYLADLGCDERNDYLVTLATFSDEHRMLCQNAPIGQVPRLTVDNYRPLGNTALLDAIAATITTVTTELPDSGKQKVLFVLATDGAENSSTQQSPGDVLSLVRRCEQRGWTFIHLAAGQQAAEQSVSLGLRNVIAIAQADLAREMMYHSVAGATKAWAAGGSDDELTGMITRDLSGWPNEVLPPQRLCRDDAEIYDQAFLEAIQQTSTAGADAR